MFAYYCELFSYRMLRCPAAAVGAGREMAWWGGATCGTSAWGRAGGDALTLHPCVCGSHAAWSVRGRACEVELPEWSFDPRDRS